MGELTWFHWAQLLVAAAIGAIVVERIRTLFYRAPLELPAFSRAMRAALQAGDLEGAERLAERGRPAWIAQVAHAALEAHRQGGEISTAIDEVTIGLRYTLERGLRSLRVMATLASASGLLGAVSEMMWLMGGDHGLAGLQAGLPEKMAVQAAVIAMTLGVTMALFCVAARGAVQRQAKQLAADLRKTVDLMERALADRDGAAEQD